MKNYFKIMLLAMALLSIAATAAAEKTLWKDKSFDFKGYRAVIISDIGNDFAPETAEPENSYFDTRAEFKTSAALVKAFEKKNITAHYTPDGDISENGTGSTAQDMMANRHAAIKPLVEVTIHKLGWEKEWKEPWVETKTVYDEVIVKDRYGRTVLDKNGRRVTKEVPRDTYIDHPGEWQYFAQVDLELVMKDPTNGKTVAIKTDNRQRDLERDTSGMLERICNDFVKDVTKN